MKFDWAIERLQDMLNEADQSFEIDALELAIKSIEAWEKIRKIYDEKAHNVKVRYIHDLQIWADARDIIDKHLIEGTTLEIEEQYLGGGRHDD